MFFAVEELFLCQDLNNLLGVIFIIQPGWYLLALWSSFHRVYHNLYLIAKRRSVLFNAAKRISQFVPVPIAIDPMRADPSAFIIIEHRIQFVGVFCLLKLFLRTIHPFLG